MKGFLRLDLCRGINRDNVFQGGLFHVFKHFTVEDMILFQAGIKNT